MHLLACKSRFDNCIVIELYKSLTFSLENNWTTYLKSQLNACLCFATASFGDCVVVYACVLPQYAGFPAAIFSGAGACPG